MRLPLVRDEGEAVAAIDFQVLAAVSEAVLAVCRHPPVYQASILEMPVSNLMPAWAFLHSYRQPWQLPSPPFAVLIVVVEIVTVGEGEFVCRDKLCFLGCRRRTHLRGLPWRVVRLPTPDRCPALSWRALVMSYWLTVLVCRVGPQCIRGRTVRQWF